VSDDRVPKPHRLTRSISTLERYVAEVSYLQGLIPLDAVAEIASEILATQAMDKTTFVFGNGGSAATASHFVCDLAKTSTAGTGKQLRAIALNESIPLVTAWANDAGYELVFAEQLATLARAGDLAISISGSGNSSNVLLAVERARFLGLRTVALTGFDGGKLAASVDRAIVVGGSGIQVIEDIHSMLCHAISLEVRGGLVGGRADSVQQPAVLCDRDGVLNTRRPGHVVSWDDFELLPGAVDALVELGRLAVPIVVISNQAAIGRALVSAESVAIIHERLRERILASGGPDVAVYLCPHAPADSCSCRKPRSGLFAQVARELGLDLAASFYIGDAITDIRAALAAGCRPIFIGQEDQIPAPFRPHTAAVTTLAEAVELIAADPAFQGVRQAAG
jgi:D-sedoheptulose 7-phosphate isomerase